jgi:hypothetical protein
VGVQHNNVFLDAFDEQWMLRLGAHDAAVLSEVPDPRRVPRWRQGRRVPRLRGPQPRSAPEGRTRTGAPRGSSGLGGGGELRPAGESKEEVSRSLLTGRLAHLLWKDGDVGSRMDGWDGSKGTTCLHKAKALNPSSIRLALV